MGDRYYDQSQPGGGYYGQGQQQQHGSHYNTSSPNLDRGGYASPQQQYNPPSSNQYAGASNMHLTPYSGGHGRPQYSPTHSGDGQRHRHHHSRSRHASRSRSRAASRRRSRGGGSDSDRSRSRTRDKIKAHKTEIGASLLGAAAGAALGHEAAGGGIATLLGAAAGAFAGNKAGDKFEKRHERKKSGRRDDDDLAYGSKYGASQRDLHAGSDEERDRNRHRHKHHHHSSRKSRSRSRKGRRGDSSDSD